MQSAVAPRIVSRGRTPNGSRSVDSAERWHGGCTAKKFGARTRKRRRDSEAWAGVMAAGAGNDPLQRLVGQSGYPCVVARSVFRRGQHTMARYPSLTAPDGTTLDTLARDLRAFAASQEPPSGFVSFVAVFGGVPPAGEEEFETALWTVLSELSARDRSGWDPTASPDPDDPSFSFSFAGRAFFIVGLHPAASRPARRCDRPALVFNPHDQFERLRGLGYFPALRSLIRKRDREFSGSPNPMLEDFGEGSEARQYSGRTVGREWKCPFHRGG